MLSFPHWFTSKIWVLLTADSAITVGRINKQIGWSSFIGLHKMPLRVLKPPRPLLGTPSPAAPRSRRSGCWRPGEEWWGRGRSPEPGLPKVGLCSFCSPRPEEQPGRSSRAFLWDLSFLPLILLLSLPQKRRRGISSSPRAGSVNFLGRQTSDPDATLSEWQRG